VHVSYFTLCLNRYPFKRVIHLGRFDCNARRGCYLGALTLFVGYRNGTWLVKKTCSNYVENVPVVLGNKHPSNPA